MVIVLIIDYHLQFITSCDYSFYSYRFTIKLYAIDSSEYKNNFF